MEQYSDQMEEEEKEEEEEIRAWSDLLPEALVIIFRKLSIEDMFMAVPLVCSSWRSAALSSECWECVDFRDVADVPLNIEKLVQLAVDRSCGRLTHFYLRDHATDEILQFIADRCSSLKCLCVPNSVITDTTFCKVACKFLDLEQLDISGCTRLSVSALQEIGRCCKSLRFLQRCEPEFHFDLAGDSPNNEEALAIAKCMPCLKHLEIRGTPITNEGLVTLLEGCSNLEYLDLRWCRNLIIDKVLAERCSRLKVFHQPLDWDDYDDFYDYSYWDECSWIDCLDDVDDYWTD